MLGKYIEGLYAEVTETGEIIYNIILLDPNTGEESTFQVDSLDGEVIYGYQGRQIIDYLPILDVYNGDTISAWVEHPGNYNDGAKIEDIFGQMIYMKAMDATNTWIQNVYDKDFVAVVNKDQPDQYEIRGMMYQLLDHEIDNPELYSKEPFDTWQLTGDTMKKRDYNRIREYYDQSDLHQLMSHLEKHLVRTVDIKLNDYIIGNNKYFVFACAKDALYIDHQPQYAEFSFPDIKSEDILANCRDDKTSPIYTNGHYIKETKLLKEIKEMKMEYMGEFPYTNEHGYTTTYVMWKTNGFFTRLFEGYGFDIRIKVGDLDNVNFRIDNKTSTSIISYTENNNISSEIISKRKTLSLNIPKPTIEEDENMDENNNTTTTPDRDEVINDAIINELDNNKDNELGVELIDSLSSSKDKLTDKQIRDLLDKGIYLI